MIPGTFDYHAPSSVDEAIELLSSLGDEAKILAGGHSLLPMMKLRFANPAHLIDLNRIDKLRGVREQGRQGHGSRRYASRPGRIDFSSRNCASPWSRPRSRSRKCDCSSLA